MLKLSDDLTEAQRIDTLYEKLTEYHFMLRTHRPSIEEGLAAVDATSSRLRTEIGRLKMIAVMEREMRESAPYKIDFDRKDIHAKIEWLVERHSKREAKVIAKKQKTGEQGGSEEQLRGVESAGAPIDHGGHQRRAP